MKEFIIHPDWDSSVTSFDADIAIAVLAIPVKFNHQFVGRVCLPIASNEEVSGTGNVVGWGQSETSEGSNDNIPNKLEVPAVTSEHCFLNFPELAKISSDRTFCGGFKDAGKAPCLGDSGGGFYLKEGAYWDIRGIVSSSTLNRDRGCSIDKYTIYTNVAKFVGWIKNMMNRSKHSNTTTYVEFICSNSRYVDNVYLLQKLQVILNRSDYDAECGNTKYVAFSEELRIKPNLLRHATIKTAETIEKLDINFTPSTHVFSDLSETFPYLKHLRITGSTLKYISRSDLEDMQVLEQLRLHKMPLDSLPEDVFWDLQLLKDLEVKHTMIEELPTELFKRSKQLIRLDLSENQLTHVDGELFKYSQNLQFLTLTKNPLKLLPSNFGWNLPNLRLLQLDGCQVNEIPLNFFEKMINLINLDLSQNPIKSLHENSFSELAALEKLNLNACELELLPENCLANLTNLLEITASFNKLTRLERGLFKNNLNLKHIQMRENKLTTILTDFFILPNIQVIDIRNNVCASIRYSKNHKDDFIWLQGASIKVNCNEATRAIVKEAEPMILYLINEFQNFINQAGTDESLATQMRVEGIVKSLNQCFINQISG